MKEMIYKQDAIDAILGEYPDAHYPTWYADIIRELQPVHKSYDRMDIKLGSEDVQEAFNKAVEEIKRENYLEILDDGTLSITLDEADFYNIKRVVLKDKSGIWCKTMYQDGYNPS